MNGLTAREIELTSLLLRGKANKQIAHEAGLTTGTVKTYLNRVFQKLHVSTRYELMAYWYQTMKTVPEVPISPKRMPGPPKYDPDVSDAELDRRALSLGL